MIKVSIRIDKSGKENRRFEHFLKMFSCLTLSFFCKHDCRNYGRMLSFKEQDMLTTWYYWHLVYSNLLCSICVILLSISMLFLFCLFGCSGCDFVGLFHLIGILFFMSVRLSIWIVALVSLICILYLVFSNITMIYYKMIIFLKCSH